MDGGKFLQKAQRLRFPAAIFGCRSVRTKHFLMAPPTQCHLARTFDCRPIIRPVCGQPTQEVPRRPRVRISGKRLQRLCSRPPGRSSTPKKRIPLSQQKRPISLNKRRAKSNYAKRYQRFLLRTIEPCANWVQPGNNWPAYSAAAPLLSSGLCAAREIWCGLRRPLKKQAVRAINGDFA